MSKKLLDLDGLRYFYGKILSRMGNLSNPNLLDNSHFPIWTRGTNFSGSANKVEYTADRWYCATAPNVTTTVSKDIDNSLKFTQIGNGSSHVAQWIEGNFENIAGKKVTLSICMKNNCDVILGMTNYLDGIAGSIVIPASLNYVVSKTTIDLPNTIEKDKLRCVVNFFNNQGTMNIKWIKVELGEIETPFSPKPYGEEKVLCERYARRLYGRSIAGAIFPNQIFFPLKDLTEMRLYPTLKTPTETNDFIIYSVTNGINYTGFSLTLGDRCLIATKANHGLTNAGIIFSDILLDSEIYY